MRAQAGHDEDASADDRSDSQCGQQTGPKLPLKAVFALSIASSRTLH